MNTHSLTSSGTLSLALAGLLAVVLALSTWFDVGEHRIPNWLTVGGLLGALVLRGIIAPQALWVGLLGAGLGFGLGILLFAAGAMGAGDGKLLVTVGAFLGLQIFLRALPLIGAFGGLLALAVSLRNGTLIPTFIRFRELLFHLVSFGRVGSRRTLATPGAVTVPYGVAVAAGAATAYAAWGLSL